jgi:DNA-binding IscR family transcriptional regulator
MLDTGKYSAIDEIAATEKISDSYVSRVLRLSLLASDLMEAALYGQRPARGA